MGVSALAASLSGANYAIYASTFSPDGYAGFFDGQVYITRALTVGGDLKVGGIKGFRIDHPLDPLNKYLHHASIESSEVLNVYSGNVQLDESGEAWVARPAWFEALNSDIRYQITAIGAPGPGLYVAQKVHQNRFMIAGSQPGSEVSWQVMGVRRDPYLERHPMSVEATKPAEEQGTYLTRTPMVSQMPKASPHYTELGVHRWHQYHLSIRATQAHGLKQSTSRKSDNAIGCAGRLPTGSFLGRR